jgi:Cu/Ag efflux pump CusA
MEHEDGLARRRGASDAGGAHVTADGLALLPVALQLHQPGHEIEGPMAVVILGGLVTSTLVSLLLIPPLAARWLYRH